MLRRKLFWWTDKSDSEWLSFRFNKWAVQCRGYTKLHSSRISRGCQTMMDRPEQPKVVFTRSVKEIIVDLPPSTTHNSDNFLNGEINEANLLEIDSCQKEPQCPAVSNTSVKNLFNNQEIVDYITYLNRPVINMNDNFIEIHQYHFSPEMLQTVPHSQEILRPPTRRKHRINTSSTDIVNMSALESSYSEKYSEFLVKKSDELNRNIEIVSESKTTANSPLKKVNDLDEHRELKQALLEKQNGEICKEEEVRIKRGHTFTVSSLHKTDDSLRVQNDVRNFLSFRSSKKNKSGRRKKKVVVGDKGLDGPIWPGVLLTFDRAVSPVQPGCDENESDV